MMTADDIRMARIVEEDSVKLAVEHTIELLNVCKNWLKRFSNQSYDSTLTEEEFYKYIQEAGCLMTQCDLARLALIATTKD